MFLLKKKNLHVWLIFKKIIWSIYLCIFFLISLLMHTKTARRRPYLQILTNFFYDKAGTKSQWWIQHVLGRLSIYVRKLQIKKFAKNSFFY